MLTLFSPGWPGCHVKCAQESQRCHAPQYADRIWGKWEGFIGLTPEQNGRHCADNISKWISCNGNSAISVLISLKYVPEDLVENKSALGQVVVNPLWPSGAIWRHKCESTLAQVMACCLAASSHYLNQCYFITNKVQWHWFEGNFTRDTSAIKH